MERISMEKARTMLDVLRTSPSTSSADECDRCGGTIVRRVGGEVEYGGGVVDYVTFHPGHLLWIVQKRLCDCAIGVAKSKRGAYSSCPKLAHGRWFDAGKDTVSNFNQRVVEVTYQRHRGDYYRSMAEKLGRDAETIERELDLIPDDHWGKDWWKSAPSTLWENPAWSEHFGVL